MTKLKWIYFLTALVLIFTSCEKEEDIKPIVLPTNDTTTTVVDNWDNTALHLYSFVLNQSQLKSTANDTTEVRYIKFVSYDSEDKPMVDSVAVGNGQRNIHEMEIYENGLNIATNAPYFDTLQNKWTWHMDSTLIYGNSVEGKPARLYDITELWRAIDGNLNSAWASNRDDGQDTVYAVVALNNIYTVDSIHMTLGMYKQTFDVFVSSDSLNWILIGGEDHPEIPVYIN